MPRFPRAVVVGCAHHITQRGVDHQTVFYSRQDRRTYLDLLAEHAEQARLCIQAYCLMTNHIHIIATPEEPDSMAIAFRRTHGRYSLYLNGRRKRSGHLWQNRYYSCALSGQHLWTALRYVERNPVRANICDRPQDYEWSSAAAHCGLAQPLKLLDLELWRQQGGASNWLDLLAVEDQDSAIRSLQRCTYAGRPFGDEEFVTNLERRLGRNLKTRHASAA